ncbi:trypsin, alkaline A-like [Spodoptera litura]|uniref:trypsin n=1 Tax=Spodoptera litura TaxID=69820 RepID=A0A9J7E3G8_SPOLT|nr:trypsin, alkaline A-like [Spodoptera litura]
MRAIGILALCLVAVAALPSSPQRIVGGSLTTINQYPHIAALLITRNWSIYTQQCGGTVINNRSILTAAHCVFREEIRRWNIRVGSSFANSGGSVHMVRQSIVHPRFAYMTRNNDIAILRTTTEIGFNNNVRPASIAGSNYRLAENQPVWAAGWGDTFSGSNAGSAQLRHVQVVVINQEFCRSNYATRGYVITENMLCSGWPSGGRDQCQGDSGGPLYHNGILVGVCSFGIGCGQVNFPGVNVRVSQFSSWITDNA